VCCQAEGRRELGDLWLSGEQDLPHQLQSVVPVFWFAGSSKPGDLMRSATDWVPWSCLAAQMERHEAVGDDPEGSGR
jgi:hypothetical protein